MHQNPASFPFLTGPFNLVESQEMNEGSLTRFNRLGDKFWDSCFILPYDIADHRSQEQSEQDQNSEVDIPTALGQVLELLCPMWQTLAICSYLT